MYTNSYSITLKGSVSAGQNNLSISKKESIYSYAVVGRNCVYLTTTQNGKNLSETQLIPKPNKDATESQILVQINEAKFINLQDRTVLVVLSTKGIFFYEEDGSTLLTYFPLTSKSIDEKLSARGVVGLGPSVIAVGTSTGTVMLFDVPPKGNKITVIEELNDRSIRGSVTSLASDSKAYVLCVGDSSGNCTVFNVEDLRNIKISNSFSVTEYPVTCLQFWRGFLISSYSNGVISIFDLEDDVHVADINAHARWINSLNVCKDLLVSAGEDCFFRVWQLNDVNRKLKVNHLHSELVTDTLITSAQFNHSTDEICVSSFDSTEIFVYKVQ